MQVIKLGGSLSHSPALIRCLAKLRAGQGRVVLVPGGGVFADHVRLAQQQWQFNDCIAHEMALLAMQQMALLFKGLQPDFKIVCSVAEIQQATDWSAPLIWSPAINELNEAKVPASWEITSDSLAAWLALQLPADKLTLVKAAPVITQNISALTQQGIVDSAFAHFTEQAPFPVHILNAATFYES